tara:strand:+ start:476 stop:688 length:213 start_codon:yes stop_codon:yes gene_type:complete
LPFLTIATLSFFIGCSQDQESNQTSTSTIKSVPLKTDTNTVQNFGDQEIYYDKTVFTHELNSKTKINLVI